MVDKIQKLQQVHVIVALLVTEQDRELIEGFFANSKSSENCSNTLHFCKLFSGGEGGACPHIPLAGQVPLELAQTLTC